MKTTKHLQNSHVCSITQIILRTTVDLTLNTHVCGGPIREPDVLFLVYNHRLDLHQCVLKTKQKMQMVAVKMSHIKKNLLV